MVILLPLSSKKDSLESNINIFELNVTQIEIGIFLLQDCIHDFRHIFLTFNGFGQVNQHEILWENFFQQYGLDVCSVHCGY